MRFAKCGNHQDGGPNRDGHRFGFGGRPGEVACSDRGRHGVGPRAKDEADFVHILSGPGFLGVFPACPAMAARLEPAPPGKFAAGDAVEAAVGDFHCGPELPASGVGPRLQPSGCDG
eukprot:4741215-Lingulodinium_polyedra.AAC.1